MKTIKKNFTALIVICLTVSALWFTNRAVTPKAASWEDVVSEAKTGNYGLITTDELRQLYFRKDVPLIVDTRQEWEFRSGHIKGAVNFPMEPTWLSRWQKKTLLEQFLGTDKDKTIIFY
ncbi:MAG: rhodanese-like domain-containing protein [Desulfobacula sp.]|nr:rhodanese-like domain-containing protein [Desulfobacula sp.]MBT3484130.1 rhodanese-like domain-containing protein [Desulfobacula sp.]MBT3803757.1 rhodanese-like domain-containing protein [Desulfobacula sp.]MBT4024462.1 rhodanese-like domain-containing protein [Desulfobacula sp.]MBT4877354.1 rhodanese-like domain-containing protein [Desulfobacula sp.]